MTERLSFRKGQLFHMTLMERLPAIVADGRLFSDQVLANRQLPGEPIAHSHIKQRRRRIEVPVPPGGVVGDYVPFYLAPRSPMLAANFYGNVESRTTGQGGIVYLVTTIERVGTVGGVVITDKHPARRPRFTDDLADFDAPGFIDWDVMFDPYFGATETDTERPERRQAEVLVHGEVPLDAIVGLAARTPAELAAARAHCQDACPSWHFNDRPDWYFG